MLNSLDLLSLAIIALAGMAGGAVNALAGGGTLITFPVLTAVGIPPVAASITNTVALSPGYFGATLAQRERHARTGTPLEVVAARGRDRRHRRRSVVAQHDRQDVPRTRALFDLDGGDLAGLAGSFARVAAAPPGPGGPHGLHEAWAIPPMFLASIYGGYFGAGLSVIVLAVLGLVLEDTLTRLNGLKQAIAFSVNIAAAIFFIFSGQVVWLAAIVMAAGALIGGALGGRLAGRVKPSSLRRIVVTIGVIVGMIYLVRG